MLTFSVKYLGSNPYHTAGIAKEVEAASVAGAILAYNGGDAEEVLAHERYEVSLEPVVVEVERASFTYTVVAS